MTQGRSSMTPAVAEKRQTKPEIAYAMLKKRLRDGDYSPDSRLVIDQLVRETGISAIPWREAIRALAAEGWLDIVPNVGARVAVVDASAYGQVLNVLARLEGYATAAALANLTSDDLKRARQINRDLTQALEDFDPNAFSRLNREFHTIFYDRCNDLYLRNLVEQQWDRLDLIRRSTFSSVPGRARDSVAEHDVLLDLIESGAPFDKVEKTARQHKLNMLNAVESARASGGARAD